MKKKPLIAAVLMLAVACGAFCFFQPLPGYNTERVHPRLLALHQPYQRVTTYYFTDGGSVGIKIVDRDGVQEQFAIPSHLGEADCYTRVYVGAIYDRKPGAVEVENPLDTKRMLVCILAAWPNRTAFDDGCLADLSRRPIDFAHVLFHRWRGDYDWPRKTP